MEFFGASAGSDDVALLNHPPSGGGEGVHEISSVMDSWSRSAPGTTQIVFLQNPLSMWNGMLPQHDGKVRGVAAGDINS